MKKFLSAIACLAVAAGMTMNGASSALAADITAPDLLSVVLDSPEEVGPGNPIKFRWTATDNNAIGYIRFWIYGPNGNYVSAFSRSSTPVGDKPGQFTGIAQTEAVESLSWPSGDYRVTLIAVADAVGNERSTSDPNVLDPLTTTVDSSIVPAPVVFTDNDGTAEDTYTVPVTEGVDYRVNGTPVQAGTYPGTGTITVTAKAKTDYALTGTTDWTATFKAVGGETPSFLPRVIDAKDLTPDLEILELSDRNVKSGEAQRVLRLDPGNWYFVTLHSTPRQMGWFRSDGHGEIMVPLPSDLDNGSHTHSVKSHGRRSTGELGTR